MSGFTMPESDRPRGSKLLIPTTRLKTISCDGQRRLPLYGVVTRQQAFPLRTVAPHEAC